MIVTGLIRYFFTDAGVVAETAGYTLEPESGYTSLAGLALALLRAARLRLRD